MRPAPLATALIMLIAPDAQAADWNGFYLGVHGSQDLQHLSAGPGSSGLGLHFGYGLQLSNLVLGIEADADRGLSSTTNVLSSTLYWDNSTNWFGSVRGRLGLALDNLQIYGTAGAAYRNVTTTLNRFGTIDSNTASTPGLVYGAGLDYRILPKLDLRLEALHYDFSGSGMGWIGNPGGLPASLGDAASDTVVRAGVSFRLN